jgi:hypothetical protein
MRRLQISAMRIGARPPAGRVRWAAWTRSMIARLSLQACQGPPVAMLWRRNPAPPSAADPGREQPVANVAPVVNLHLSVRSLIRNHWRERVVERAFAPFPPPSRAERRTLVDHSRTESVENHTRERLILAPREDAATQTGEREALPLRSQAQREDSPERRPRPNVAHAFDRLLIRRERVTREETVDRLMRRARRVEETVTPPRLALPKPAAPAHPPAAGQPDGAVTRRRGRNEAVISSQPQSMQAQWAAALDPNRLADQVLREMDRRLVARKERFGRL